MTKHDHKDHQHGHDHQHNHHAKGWKPHRDWRVWVVALMLLSMVVYVMTMDESIWPGGTGPEVPAAPAPASP